MILFLITRKKHNNSNLETFIWMKYTRTSINIRLKRLRRLAWKNMMKYKLAAIRR